MEKLIDLFQAGTNVKEFKVNGLSFKMRTITADELIDVLKHADYQSSTPETKFFLAKKMTIAYSLEAINGVEILAIPEVVKLKSDLKDEKLTKADLLMKILGSFDAEVIDTLYDCYNVVVTENNKKREELKKVSVAQ